MFVRSGFARPPPVASCQFNHHHHPHPSPGPPTGPQATLLRWPFVRVSAVDVVVVVVVDVVVCRAHKFFVPAAYSIARSVNTLLTEDDCPSDCQTVRQSTISISNSIYICHPCHLAAPVCLSVGCFHHSVSNG